MYAFAKLRRLTCWVAACASVTGGAAAATPALAASPYDARIVQTSGNLSQRLTVLPDQVFGAMSQAAHLPVINVNARVHYQTVKGFGAAMTDTSAWLMEREISPPARDQLFGQLFGAAGIHLNFVRIPMGASDFTRNGVPYTYDDMPAGRSDPGLRHFSIAHDLAYIIPALHEARAVNPGTRFLASPWSAPAWMKGNDSLSNVGNRGTLRGSAYRAWAQYFARFLAAYGAAGVPVSALTVQNEPLTPTLYPGMNFTADAEADWIVSDLKPALAARGLHPSIYGGDLGWGPNNNGYMNSSLFGRAGSSLAGISWHCYYGAPGVMNVFRAADPRIDQIVDECSPGGTSPTPTSEIVISSLRDWASTVALWNLALDVHGGPVQVPNHGCPACVGLASIDEKTGNVGLTRAYYQLGQASAFVAPGAQRIWSNHFVAYAYPHAGVSVVTPGLDDVAFRNPDGSIVLVMYDNAPLAVKFAVAWRGRALPETLAPQTMMTMVFNRP